MLHFYEKPEFEVTTTELVPFKKVDLNNNKCDAFREVRINNVLTAGNNYKDCILKFYRYGKEISQIKFVYGGWFNSNLLLPESYNTIQYILPIKDVQVELIVPSTSITQVKAGNLIIEQMYVVKPKVKWADSSY